MRVMACFKLKCISERLNMKLRGNPIKNKTESFENFYHSDNLVPRFQYWRLGTASCLEKFEKFLIYQE